MEQVTLMTNPSRGFSAVKRTYFKINDWNWPVCLVFPRSHTCPPYLKISGRSNQNELVTLMTKSNSGCLGNQGDVTLRWSIETDQYSDLYEISSIYTLSASYRSIQLKLKELWWWQVFSHCKSMEPCGCHSNQTFRWISIKKLCYPSPTRGMLQMRYDWDQPAGCGYMKMSKVLTGDKRTTIL